MVTPPDAGSSIPVLLVTAGTRAYPMSQSEPSIPWPETVKFIGQFNHDIRNHLNAIELQSAFLGEIIEEAEAKDEVRRLREMTAAMGAALQKLSGQLSKINPSTMSYQGVELIEDLQSKITATHPAEAAAIEWHSSLGQEPIEIDPHLLIEAFAELFANAFTHSRGSEPLGFSASADDGALVFTLREPKAEALEVGEDWGTRPFAQVRHGHYGLGLFRARAIVAAHQGTMRTTFDPAASTLVTIVTLPQASA
ncbi:MAG: sensor histidine kinase [Chthoniobacterales bacterium]